MSNIFNIMLIVADYTTEPSFTLYPNDLYPRYDIQKHGSDFSKRDDNLNFRVFRNIWNILSLRNNDSYGYYVRYSDGLPKTEPLSVIFVVQEHEKSIVEIVKAKYPEAQIIAYMKEVHPCINIPSATKTLYEYKGIKVASPYTETINSKFQTLFGCHNIWNIPYPYFIKKIRNVIGVKKSSINGPILVGSTVVLDRGFKQSIELANEVGKRTGLQVKIAGNWPWRKWLTAINNASVVINCDPLPKIGQCPIECAILETLHIGGNLDAVKTLWCDIHKTDNISQVEKVIDIMNVHSEITKSAYKNVVDRHDINQVKIKLHKYLGDFNK